MINMVANDTYQNKTLDKGKELYRFRVTDNRVNRNGWRILTQGIDTKPYEENPIVLLGHDSTKIIGSASNINQTENYIDMSIWFHEESEESKLTKKLIDLDVIKMTSIGIQPKLEAEEKIPPNFKGVLPNWINKIRVFTESELREVSIVPIPANTGAALQKKIVAAADEGLLTNAEVASATKYLENYFSINNNELLTNQGENDMSLEIENTELKNKVENLTKEKDAIIKTSTDVNNKLQENIELVKNLTAEKAEMETKLNEASAESETIKTRLAELESKQVESEIENFLLQNQAKIMPAEKDNLKAELILLHNNSDLKINDKTMFEYRCSQISGRVENKLGEEIADKKDMPKDKKDNSILDFNSKETEDIEACDKAVKEEMKTKNISYEEAFELLKNQSEQE